MQAYTPPCRKVNWLSYLLYPEQRGSNKLSYIYLISSYM